MTLTSRERARLALSHQEGDRVPMFEISYWPETIERWEKEGLPKGADPLDYFGMDRVHFVYPDSTLRLPSELVEEGTQYRLERDSDGVLLRSIRGSYVPPSEVGWSIQTADDWRSLRQRMVATPDRFGRDTLAAARHASSQGQFVVLSPVEPAWYFIRTLGLETASVVMMQQPDFFDDVLEVMTQFNLDIIELAMQSKYPLDAVWYFSDLCYRNGMLFSPRLYRVHVLPRLRRICALCHELGLKVIYHCDGYVAELIPLLIEAGADCIQPLEARAGNDLRIYRQQYQHRIAFFGNISADVIAEGKFDTIEDEVQSKVSLAKEGGGYLYHIDHSVPPGVSFAAYSWLIECVKRYGTYA